MGHTTYRSYCPIQIEGYSTYALVDSGNSVGNAMSWNFAKTIGIRLQDLEEDPHFKQVTTAEQGASLKVMGRPKRKLHLRLGQLATKFTDKPIIIDGLSMAFNLSGPFMRKHHIDQLHSKQAIMVQGKLLPLTIAKNKNNYQELAKVEPTEVPVYVNETTTIPAHAARFVTVRVPAAVSGRMKPGNGIVEAQAHFVERTDLHPALAVLGKVDKNGCATVSVLNTTEEAITIREGQKYGVFKKT